MELKVDRKFCRNILILLVLLFGVYLWMHETERVKEIISFLADLFFPFLTGAGLAFVLNVPMRFIEKKLAFIGSEKPRRLAAILSTVLAVVIVIAGVLLLLVPQIRKAIAVFAEQLPPFFRQVNEFLLKQEERYPGIFEALGVEMGADGVDWMKLVEMVIDHLETGLSDLVGSALSLVSNIFTLIYNGVFSVIFSFYCLAQKETLARQGRKLLYATVKEGRADKIVRVLRMSNSTFSNFITGQCLDAVILGLMCAAVMAILRMPYIPLISVIIIVTALIPVVGALVGGAVGAFLIFVSSPLQAVIFLVMFVVVQQIDNNVVYPRVVGTSIGLPGMWVLVAVLVGEGVMGVAGMLIMVPFASVLYTLIREFADKRVRQRGISEEKLKCQPPELQPHFMFRRAAMKRAEKKQKKQQEE